MLIGFGVARYRLKIRFFESLEAIIIGLMPWLSLIYLLDAIKKIEPIQNAKNEAKLEFLIASSK